MTRSMKIGFWMVGLASVLAVVYAAVAADERPRPAQVDKLMRDGNWKEAYEGFSKLALGDDVDPMKVSGYLTNAIKCLTRLGRVNETDAFRERVIAAHAKNWRLLQTAAETYLSGQHWGYIIAGEFERGHHRGGGKYVSSYERDRVRALQLMQQAMGRTAGERDKPAVAEFHLAFARMLMGTRGYYEAWRLQYLSDLTKLPDYDEGGSRSRWGWRGRSPRGAPVDADGKPVYHHLPKSWKAAESDGERWRWCLSQASAHAPARAGEIRFLFASFLHNQFGVQTMAEYGWYFRRPARQDDETRKDESGTWALHTLEDNETIAKLANGIKRFKLPDEFNFLKIFRELAEKRAHNNQPREMVAKVFENRRQYPRAAEQWRLAIKEFGRGNNNWRQKRLDQIVDNWGLFEPVMTQPGGKGATVEYRFRNGRKVSFTAHEIDIAKLLADVKAYLETRPPKLDWDKVNISRIGYRLVTKNQKQYVGKQVAGWDLELKPRPNHFDKRITVSTPLQKAGAYLLVARMDGGNVSRIVLWVADTVLVKKPLDKKSYYFVADAVTGRPIPKANLEFFGYWQEYVANKDRRVRGSYVIHTRNFAEFSDADGQLILKPDEQDRRYRWIITATTPQGRLAYLGFTGVWFGNYYDREYKATKTFVITDRPVYRPGHAVKFKFWVNHAKYDQEGASAFAGRKFVVEIRNPKNEKVLEKTFTADDYGGFDGELSLAADATLGVYRIFLPGNKNPCSGGGSFRVEEYKKPEFEVTIEAPDEPVMLGEKIAAKIQAKYYFGAPVTEAKVKYKVLRTSHSAEWYPICYWDWFYGPGYWWFAYDYVWYPGWRQWGCMRPLPWWWWQWHPREQPEVVAEAEAPIGEDGTFKIEIDTALAKAVHADTDHKYEITAEVTDQSRRTIVGKGTVLVARKPFKVYAWVNRGHYRVGDVVHASFNAQTLDKKPVKGAGVLKLFKVTYDKDNKPVENQVQKWNLDTNEEGRAEQQIKASAAGQYRLSYTVTDAKKHAIEGGYVFVIRGEGFDGSAFRFNDIELVPEKKEYKPGEKVDLMVNTNRVGSTVLLFVRPANGIYLAPKILRLKGKSVKQQVEVLKRDMPNFFVEALTVSGGKVYTEAREIVVPPESRVLDVEVTPSAKEYKPGAKAKVAIKLTDPTGEPYSGSTVVAIYDKAVEYISGGSNVQAIKEFFWKWRRRHRPRTESSLDKRSSNLTRPNEIRMSFLGVFGHSVAEELGQMDAEGRGGGWGTQSQRRKRAQFGAPPAPGVAAPARAMAAKGADNAVMADRNGAADKPTGGAPGEPPMVQPTVRTKFADTALWVAALQTDKNGRAEVELTMPENLTTWKARVWAMGAGTRVGEGTAEVVTTKDLIIRLQAPRFFVQTDEVVLSANVHNYLKSKKSVKVSLELEGAEHELIASPGTAVPGLVQTVQIDPKGEKRVDWRIRVKQPGNLVVRMKALSDEESDAMQMEFPVYIHGMLKTESFSGVIRPDGKAASIAVRVPAERLPEQSRLEIRYSPTLAGAMVDALPYMVDYPYGCTEQTLNRFLPTVITQKVLLRMGLDLKEIQKKRTNLNAQEIGDDVERAKQWARMGFPRSRDHRNPVFDVEEVQRMVKAGLARLTSMQCADGGWGWFSGWGERSYPHTTAVVVHGLQIAAENDVAIVPSVMARGVAWLKKYQAREVRKLRNAPRKVRPWKDKADNLDAMVYMVLADAKADNKEMRDFLYRDRNGLAVYAKAMFGLALHKVGDREKRDMVVRNIDQFLVTDDENQTAYLKLPAHNWWWCWYGSEYEAQAYYLKLLAATNPKAERASRLVKYLINNRKHATYWNSTRDTAVVVEAFADYIKASGEDKPDMTLRILIDGKQAKQVKINAANLFTFDNKLVLEGKQVKTGPHKIELVRTGTGPVYFNAYLTNFTLEDPITKAGLEIKVQRKYYKLVKVDKKIKAVGQRGQVLDQKVEKYERKELKNLATLKSGDLVEIELEIESKNDYEYILFEDMKAAGFEPVEVRSGYNGNGLGAYMELRDERVTFFVRALARGNHSVSYRMRAEIPGRFSALPTKASAMYAPELKANSDELKLRIED